MTIGESIRKYRKEAKITQKRLAEMVGLNEVTIRSYEAGKYKPKIEQLRKIANILNVNVDIFIYTEKENLQRIHQKLGEVEYKLFYTEKNTKLEENEKQEKIQNYKNEINEIKNEIASISNEISELHHIKENERIKLTWELIKDMDEKRKQLIIEILRTHNYKVIEKDSDWLVITDHQGFSFDVDIDDFQEMIERCDRDIRYNIEKILNDSRRKE